MLSESLRHAVMAEFKAMNRRSFDLTFWNSFNETAWGHTLEWLDLSGLALYFWHKVKGCNSVESLPAFVRMRLARCYEENCLRVESIREEAAFLNKLFDAANVQHAVLKGFALVPDYCPHPALRTQYDLDYLVPPEKLAQAEAVLQRSGYIPKISGEDYHITYVRPNSRVLRSEKHVGLYSAGLERPVELHIALWDPAEERIAIPLPGDFLRRSRKRAWQEFEYWSLGDEDALIFQSLHAFRHILNNWCRLSTFLEVSYFLQSRAEDTDFWARFCDRITNLRWVSEASALVFRIAQSLFGGFIPTDLNLQVDPNFSTVLDLWIERYGLPGALANFQDSKNSLFLHREFVVGRSVWTEVWRRRLFPLRRPHHMPKVMTNRQTRRLGKKWAHVLHGLQRFQFHAVAAARYAWEYPRWRLLRRTSTLDRPKARRSAEKTVSLTDCHPGRSPKSVATKFSDISIRRD